MSVPPRLRAVLGVLAMAILVGAGVAAYLAGREDARSPAPGAATRVGWTATPQQVAPLAFQGASAKAQSLEDFRGKVVLLNIWATWCAPCREEMPALDRLQQALGGPDFEVVALSIDAEGMAAVRRFYDEVGIRALTAYVDPSMRAGPALRIIGVPTTVLLDREGNERWRKAGPEKWDAPGIVEALREKLRESRAR